MERNSRLASQSLRRALHNDIAYHRLRLWHRLLMAEAQSSDLSPAEVRDFARWAVKNLLQAYKEQRMNQRILTENQMRSLGIRLPNATVKKEYLFPLPQLAPDITDIRIVGLEETGLHLASVQEDGSSEPQLVIKGHPTKAGSFPLILEYKIPGWLDGDEISQLPLPLTINPDPRTLWKNIPTNPDIIFFKPDSAAEFLASSQSSVPEQQKDMVAASQRGRSHAQEGKARDDHFRICRDEASGWNVMVVADGAGSARFSRKGSQVACDTTTEQCLSRIKEATELEPTIEAYANDRKNPELYQRLAHLLYGILGQSAFQAHRAINEIVKANDGTVAKDFATTLLCTIAKPTSKGWFIASFWVGDGAICVYDEATHTARMMGTPDEGEYAGQTRFLTMQSIFQDSTALMNRVRFDFFPDFTALIMLSDGVSDPMFETDNNLQNPARWDEFFSHLRKGFPQDEVKGVELEKRNDEVATQLLQWLDFWSPGNHDDRTIALMY